MDSEYYKDTPHQVKIGLAGQQDESPSGDETDSVYYIKDMSMFSSSFVQTLRVGFRY